MPIPASRELTEFLYISCHKNTALPFGHPASAGARVDMSPATLPAAAE